MISGFTENPFRIKKTPFIRSIFHPEQREDLLKLDSAIIAVVQAQDNDYKITVTFPSVPNAQKYRLVVNGATVSINTTNEFEWELPENGTYNISVRSYASGFKASTSNVVQVEVKDLGSYLFTGLRTLFTGLRKILTGR